MHMCTNVCVCIHCWVTPYDGQSSASFRTALQVCLQYCTCTTWGDGPARKAAIGSRRRLPPQAPRCIQGTSPSFSKAVLGLVPCACVLVSPLYIHRLCMCLYKHTYILSYIHACMCMHVSVCIHHRVTPYDEQSSTSILTALHVFIYYSMCTRLYVYTNTPAYLHRNKKTKP